LVLEGRGNNEEGEERVGEVVEVVLVEAQRGAVFNFAEGSEADDCMGLVGGGWGWGLC
jgi:hypothetical protein